MKKTVYGSPAITQKLKAKSYKLLSYTSQVEIVMTIAFILLCLTLTILTPRFLTIRNFRNLFWQATFLGIIAIGQTLVILTGGIDLSVGSNAAVAAMFGGIVMQQYGVIPGVIAMLLLGTLVGVMKGFLVAYARLAAFIVTLGFLSIGRSATYLLTDGRSLVGLPAEYRFFGNAEIGSVPLYLIVFVALFIMAYFMLKQTKVGLYIYAIGSNEEAAHLSGVRVRFYTALTYAITGFLCAVSGLILTSRLGAVDPDTGINIELNAIAAVVIGGTSLAGGKGGLIGTLIGIAIITVLNNGLNLLGVSPFWQGAAVGVVIIFSVLLDSVIRQFKST
ncbi:ABC transporter permease [Marispirochaeta sp.]|jgi:ribose transport system permease protein|uniref:ABC transporter permease n=1 Tax=Marispirochaeta sp. TaxID=2038653 RepID=UPI0029C6F842|nr:ABC transporter permease [Marispirochaeta sp.]